MLVGIFMQSKIKTHSALYQKFRKQIDNCRSPVINFAWLLSVKSKSVFLHASIDLKKFRYLQSYTKILEYIFCFML